MVMAEEPISKRSEFAAEDMRLSLQKKKIDVGPATYTPRVQVVKKREPNFSFGRAGRFMNSKLQYLSPKHDSDQLCEAGPGPKYLPNKFFVTKTAPAFSMGPHSRTVDDRDREAAADAAGLTSRGPSAYNPKYKFIKPTGPRTAFGLAKRFMDNKGLYVSEQHGMRDVANSFGKPAANHYYAKDYLTSRQAAAFSFGPVAKPGQRKLPQTDRTSFITHSVRGGKALPATLECEVEFTKYNPGGAMFSGKRGDRKTFSKSARFNKSDYQYISKLHADAQTGYNSPGPKYAYKQGEFGEKLATRTPRGGALSWVP